MKTVVASGFFDPLHVGHLEYLARAKELGDQLIVLVNSDRAAVNKKGYFFQKQEDRIQIISSICFVDKAYAALDDDGTVAQSLKLLKPSVFAKGGDWSIANLPSQELEICSKFGIEIVTELGVKIASSSQLVKNATQTIPSVKLETEQFIYYGETQLTLITLEASGKYLLTGNTCRWFVLSGRITVVKNNTVLNYSAGEEIRLIGQVSVQVRNETAKCLKLLKFARY